MVKYQYEFAEIILELQCPYEAYEQENFRIFRVRDKEPDVVISYEYAAKPLVKDKGIITDKGEVFCTMSQVKTLVRRDNAEEPLACLVQERTRNDFFKCYLFGNMEGYLDCIYQLIELADLEYIFLKNMRMILHASFIRWNGSGILFTAPSGTGKSTQADLWVKYEGAEVLNGDRAAIHVENEKVRAFGLPFAGSSGIYKKESAPLSAIVVLRQGKENQIRLLSPREAFSCLFSETVVHSWDKQYVEEMMELIDQLVTEVPVYLLFCRPDREAVEVLKKEIMR